MNARMLQGFEAGGNGLSLARRNSGGGMAETLIAIAGWYAAVGAVVGALFIAVGLDRIDSAAHGSWLFRALLMPGLVLLWPVVLLRWLRLELGRRN